ncbi:RDD family protein [Actinomadura nitritigenes]|uniref:RDD family protein n=1 Tax=Actinomadura nitritigenes TaxID=134602 RepID=UPI003D8EDD9A
MTEPPQNAEPPEHSGAPQRPEAPEEGRASPDAPSAQAQPDVPAPAEPDGPAQAQPGVPAPAGPADDRPPPYQGTYGAPPGRPQPVFTPPAGNPAPGSGQAGYGQGPGAQQAPYGPGQPPYGQAPHPQAPYGQAPYGPGAGYGPPSLASGDPHAPASRGLRFAAGLIDRFIVGVFNVPVVLFAIRWDRLREVADSGQSLDNPLDAYDLPRLAVGYAVAMLLGVAYYTVQHAVWGKTIGKRAVGIRVVRADDRTAAGWGQIIARQGFVFLADALTTALTLLVPLGGLIGFVALLDNAWILWDRDRRAVHDKVAGTVVVRAPAWAPDPYART